VSRLQWLCIACVLCLLPIGCNKHLSKKPDPTKGAVTGIVLCADTGKPARFATVTLSAAPKKDEKLENGDPLPSTESTYTDLDGRFRIEAVEPGRYYAFATLEGYLDPMTGLDFSRLDGLASDRERNLDAISQWKDHLVEVTARVHRTSEIALEVERGAEIGGTVTFDDGSPAIGMHFQAFRKTEKDRWAEVGLALFRDWSMPAVSDSHGRFTLTNLPSGEYTVCALMPSDKEDAAARICLGNVFRRKDAGTVKVRGGEVAGGVDIVIPLNGLHTVAGTVSALADGHALGQGDVQMLYADDREKAREVSLQPDGSFALEYVPEGKYILRISEARDVAQKDPEPGDGEADSTQSKAKAGGYADKEMLLNVLDNMEDVQVQVVALAPEKPRGQ
jgi:hypothetical protein